MEQIKNFQISENAQNSKYVKIVRTEYEQSGHKKVWDVVQSHNAVAILIFDKDKQSFIFVKQFRPPIFVRHMNIVQKIDREQKKEAEEGATEESKSLKFWKQFISLKKEEGAPASEESTTATSTPGGAQLSPSDVQLGLAIELCAGLCDKMDKTVEEIAIEEVEEETGYHVKNLEYINHYYVASGSLGMLQFLYYAEVDSSMKLSSGGGVENEGEFVETVEVPISEALQYIQKSSLTTTPALLYAVTWWFMNKKQVQP